MICLGKLPYAATNDKAIRAEALNLTVIWCWANLNWTRPQKRYAYSVRVGLFIDRLLSHSVIVQYSI